MKKFYLLLLLLSINIINAQQGQWLTGIEHSTGGFLDQVSVDAQGNAYTYALFNHDIILSDYQLSVTSEDHFDAYFVKYNAAGQRQWIRQITGNGDEYIRCQDVDAAGNVYISGSFFNGINFGTVQFTGVGSFVAKYDTNGNFQWAKRYSYSFPKRIAVLDTGQIYIAGTFQTPLAYGTLTLTNSTSNNFVSYLLKLDALGEVVWGKMADTTSDQDFTNDVYGLAVDASGNAYMSGWHGPGNIIFGSITLSSASNSSNYVVKYNAAGVEQWAKRAGNSSCSNTAQAVAVDANGNVYIVGSYCGSINFSGTVLPAATNSVSRMYIVKYDSTGALVWAKTSASTGVSMVRSVDIDATGNLIVGGNYSGTLDLGNSASLTTPTMAKFIAKYTSAGSPVWITGSSEIDYNNEIFVKCFGTNTIYSAGTIINVPTFSIGGQTYTKTGENLYNIHIGKMLDIPLSNNDFKAVQASVYPNPVTNTATVESLSPVVNIIVYDINGHKVAEYFNSNNVNMEKLESGIYILNVYTEKGPSVVKVVKQ